MWLSRKQTGALALAAGALVWPGTSRAEIKLAEVDGWVVTTDGRVNAFVSHVWGDNRPEGLESLNWVGFNESTSEGQLDKDGKLRKTKIRSGYVPSTLAFNFRKQMSENLKIQSRVEVGIQITNTDPAFISDPTWMDPRSVYLDLSGNWGSVRAGRDFSLFSRGNLFMNYEIGHAYGLGFPCAYERMFGGACGHVGFGTLWPDFRAQITYTTPSIADIVSVSLGVFDPRTIPTYEWHQTPLPRFEAEAVANYSWREGWGVKAWANGFHQRVGTSADIDTDMDALTAPVRQDFTQDAYGAGGGVQANLGPVKAGVSGYMGRGMDAFVTFTFNPIFIGQSSTLPNHLREFRTTMGFLAQASVTFGNTWVMGGFGQARFDRMGTDIPIETVDAFPLIRSHTGISAGVFHRLGHVVLGLDYFNAHYAFDPRRITSGAGPTYVEVAQTVHIVNAGVTLEW
jgi:Gram-negative porin